MFSVGDIVRCIDDQIPYFNGLESTHARHLEDVDAPFSISRFKPLISKSLPASLTNLLKNPKSVILPNEGNRWDVRKQKEKIR